MNKPSKPQKDIRSGTDALVRARFTTELTEFLKARINSTDSWPGVKNDDLIAGVVEAVKITSKQIPNGMGLSLLLSLGYAAIDEAMQTTGAEIEAQQAPSSTPKKVTTGTNNETIQSIAAETKNSSSDFSPISFSGQAQSPLFKIGYSVAANGISEEKRRSILKAAYHTNPDTAFSTHETLATWGDAGTQRRLYAIARFLVWLVDFQGTDKPEAKVKWLEDLAWLKAEFFNEQIKFTWPQPTLIKKTTPRSSPNAAFMQPMTPSAALAKIVGTKPLPRTEVTMKVWAYIKKHKLQDTVNKRIINADTNLQVIFKKPQLSMFEMTKMINEHLS